jgi:hypothetical protein
MTVRHIAMFRFAEHVTDDDINVLATALRMLPDRIEELRDYRVGRDLGLSDRTWDFAVVADLDDADAYERYRTHPDHAEIVKRFVLPLAEERATVQFEL